MSNNTEICRKHTSRFICSLAKGHSGPHGRSYRRKSDDPAKVKFGGPAAILRAQDHGGAGWHLVAGGERAENGSVSATYVVANLGSVSRDAAMAWDGRTVGEWLDSQVGR